MKRLFIFLVTLAVTYGCAQRSVEPISIVPKPVKMEQHDGIYTLKSGSIICCDESNARLSEIATMAADMVKRQCGVDISVESSSGDIRLRLVEDSSANPESYRLQVDGRGILIEAPTTAGIFYGVQTLSQLIDTLNSTEVDIAFVDIEDYPRLEWRGANLCATTKPFTTKEEIKVFIDAMSAYKLNRFHWHLTDDSGWKIEIEKYPNLTKNMVSASGQKEYYTKEDMRELIAYAHAREVEIVPEIDVPGHSTAAVSAYPEYHCPLPNFEFKKINNVSNGIYCAGNEDVFGFLEDVFSEVIELFPSEYIHLGGDEAPKNNWRECPLCQKRIKDEGLTDEYELQSYFVKRIEKIITSKGRKMIGWDEIVEGGLSTSATLMVWRTTTFGVEAAEAGNKVIMTPETPLYIHRGQSINRVTDGLVDKPINTLKAVYDYNPIPKELSAEYHKNIIGVQGSMWGGCPDFFVTLYNAFPRTIAIAEMAWTPQQMRDWDDFYQRLQRNLKYLDQKGVAYGQPSYDVKIAIIPTADKNGAMVELTSEVPDNIYYTLDGSEPTRYSTVYSSAVEITSNTTVKAVMFRRDGSKGRVASEDILYHKALAKSVKYDIPFSDKHNGGGDYAMTNGMLGKWQGFEKRDVDMTLDLGAVTEVSSIKSNWRYGTRDWIYKPTTFTYEISKDGEKFEEVLSKSHKVVAGVYENGIEVMERSFSSPVEIRYIRVKATSIKINPMWHIHAGVPMWLFVDEIVVE